MSLTQHIARHLREIHFGENWTLSNMKDALQDVTWQEAITPVYNFNSIAALTCHTTYYVSALIDFLHGKPLISDDKESFIVPEIKSQHDWEQILAQAWANAEAAAKLVEQLPESILTETFSDEERGNYFRNIQGNIEHMHYHLGQIVLIKKMLRMKVN